MGRLGYNLWSCLDGRCAVLAYQPLFECQHGDAPFIIVRLIVTHLGDIVRGAQLRIFIGS
jgi:hypothetical protein